MLLTGARQVGKTIFLKYFAEPTLEYVTLHDPLVLSLAKSAPALFMQRFPPPVIIDEIQYAPEFQPHIKMQGDTHKQSGAYWLTGSHSSFIL